jgi:hypothetical protein
MKGAFVLANDPQLYAQIEEVLELAGGQSASDRTVQVEDASGHLFTVFGTVGPEFEADVRAAPTGVRGNLHGFDQDTATACWVECRSKPVFIQWIRVIAHARANPTWVLDGDGQLWAVDVLDPEELVL